MIDYTADDIEFLAEADYHDQEQSYWTRRADADRREVERRSELLAYKRKLAKTLR